MTAFKTVTAVGVAALVALTLIGTPGAATALRSTSPDPLEITAVTPPVVTGGTTVGSRLMVTIAPWSRKPSDVSVQVYIDDQPFGATEYLRYYGQNETKTYSFLAPPEALDRQVSVSIRPYKATAPDYERLPSGPAVSTAPLGPFAANPWVTHEMPDGQQVSAFSCYAQDRCFALTNGVSSPDVMSLYGYDGQGWTKVRALGPARNGELDCTDDGFCMFWVSQGSGRTRHYVSSTFDGQQWSALTPMPRLPTSRRPGVSWGGFYLGLSCADAGWCAVMLVGGNTESNPYGGGSGGWLMVWTAKPRPLKAPAQSWMTSGSPKTRAPGLPSQWSNPLQATPGNHLFKMDCPSRRRCLTYDGQYGTLGFFDPKTEKYTPGPKDNIGGWSAACASTTMCVAYDPKPGVNYVWNGQSWVQLPIATWLESVGCRQGVGCFSASVTGWNGSKIPMVTQFLNGAWTPPVTTGVPTGSPVETEENRQMIECWSATHCLVAASGHYWVMG